MSDLDVKLEQIAEAGVAGIVLLPLDEPRARRRARARGIAASAVAVCVVLGAVAIAVSLRSPAKSGPAAQGGSKLVASARYKVPSESMVPTLDVGDVVAVATKFDKIERGDVVRVRFPKSTIVAAPPGGDAGFKRVVAVPGDSVQGRGGHVFVNGREVAELYPGVFTSEFARLVVPSGSYYLLGDNRGNSKDSRMWGPIARSEIVGIALRITGPATRAGAIVGSPR